MWASSSPPMTAVNLDGNGGKATVEGMARDESSRSRRVARDSVTGHMVSWPDRGDGTFPQEGERRSSSDRLRPAVYWIGSGPDRFEMSRTCPAYEANANRVDRSTARTCLVMPPIEMQSTPVSATLRTVSSVTRPDASMVTRWP